VKLTKTEPVALQGAVTAILSAVVAVLTAFDWWDPSEEQIGALAGILSALIAAGAAFARGRVWAPDSVADLVASDARELTDAREERDAALGAMAEAQEALQANAKAQADYWAGRTVTEVEVEPLVEPPDPVPAFANVAEHRAARSAGLT
jgi:hypothetical protein